MENKGQLVISSQGLSSKEKLIQWIYALALGVALIWLGVFLAGRFGYTTTGGFLGHAQRTTQNVFYPILVGGGVLAAVIVIGIMGVRSAQLSKLKINVFESGVTGIGTQPNFAQGGGNSTALSFSLTYDQISSVDIVNKWYVSINSFGTTYLVYAKNAAEVAAVINRQKAAIK